jgi:hypothetical protein
MLYTAIMERLTPAASAAMSNTCSQKNCSGSWYRIPLLAQEREADRSGKILFDAAG